MWRINGKIKRSKENATYRFYIMPEMKKPNRKLCHFRILKKAKKLAFWENLCINKQTRKHLPIGHIVKPYNQRHFFQTKILSDNCYSVYCIKQILAIVKFNVLI